MLLSQMEELRESIARRDSPRDVLIWRRDQLILKALQAKIPVEIISASGVSRVRVFLIRVRKPSKAPRKAHHDH